MAANYHDVCRQLTDYGLIVDRLEVGRMRRCKVEGDREKRGWYILHELTLDSGDQVLVGSYGIWRGSDNGAQKVELAKMALSDEQRAAIKKRLADDRKRAAAAEKASQEQAAKKAESVWLRCSPTGDHDYLTRKGVGAHGVRFSPKGALVIPMLDAVGRVHGLQMILSRANHAKRIERTGRDKEFWPAGLAKRGHFHLIGAPGAITLVAEGYATGATLHQATGLPVVVTFDAGNIAPALDALRGRYKQTRWLICADDDARAYCDADVDGHKCRAPVDVAVATCPACGQPHKRGNAGVSAASAAAMSDGRAFVVPIFADEAGRKAKFQANGAKISDFNDLAALEGLHTVRVQVEDKIRELGWRATQTPARAESTGGEGNATLRPIESYEELLERYALIYGHSGTVFDFQERILLSLSDMRDACTQREYHRRWQECPNRMLFRVSEVGFDPTERDDTVKCNLWGGWPTTPKAGGCERLLELLEFMCSGEADKKAEVFRWVLRWLAYPIQHPGAKMRTTLVIQGPQGTGKNLFFECIMSIYGPYGRIIDQAAVEDKFNDWASRKLFMIADEVVARSDLYHIKNKLKGLITGTRIRINPKNVGAYEEANHVNLVFLSNEVLPAVIERDDRRHCVIWTPPKLSQEFYDEVGAEIRNGGIAALHDYLLKVDLGDFNEHTKPPATQAKADLVELSMDSISRFWRAWVETRYTGHGGAVLSGELTSVPVCPALSEDIYALYRAWCARTGVAKPAQMTTVMGVLSKQPGASKHRSRYQLGQTTHNPAMYLMPPGARPCPEGEGSPPAWLGQQFEAFRFAVSDYRSADIGGARAA